MSVQTLPVVQNVAPSSSPPVVESTNDAIQSSPSVSTMESHMPQTPTPVAAPLVEEQHVPTTEKSVVESTVAEVEILSRATQPQVNATPQADMQVTEGSPSATLSPTTTSIGFLLAESVSLRPRKQLQPAQKRPRGRPRKTPGAQPQRKAPTVIRKRISKPQATSRCDDGYRLCKRCCDRIAQTYANTPYMADAMVLMNFCGECHANAVRMNN
jgi:hypothetical protein